MRRTARITTKSGEEHLIDVSAEGGFALPFTLAPGETCTVDFLQHEASPEHHVNRKQRRAHKARTRRES